jgi:gamma-polyglutamate biosynthesis protein CapC
VHEVSVLSLWPPHGLDQTIHLGILLGVLVLLYLTEAYGWVFNGLVVPGYLASVFVIQPAAGVAVIFESLLTFALARVISDVLGRTGAWSRFFGRERFFLIILVSVIVRQQSQLWLLPDLLGLVDDRFGSTFHLERSFSSIGLVLVPLTANMFWKLDLRRGLVQVGVPTLVVYALLRFLFLRYTNLSLSSLELTYENVALDFLASPKAYILLLTGAYLASRYNLLYGWDFSGVLVPALLALACFSPWRLVTTTVEALALVLLVSGLLKIPWVRARNVEGPRKIALVFTVSFALKWIVGWLLAPRTPWGAALLLRLPEFSVTDLYGFGYLVPSLLATKMLSKGERARVLVPTLQVAALTFVLGSVIGFALDQIAPSPPRALVPELRAPIVTSGLLRSPQGVMAIAQVRARLDVASDAPLRRPYQELAAYARLWRDLDRWLAAPTEAMTAQLGRDAKLLGLTLTPLPGEGYALVEAEERLVRQVGWDSAVLYPGAPGPVLEVPRPWSEAPAAPAAALLCAALKCRAVVASGVDTAAAGLPSGDALVAAWAPLAVAHGQLRTAPVIQVRADETLGAGEAVLHIRDILPPVQLPSLWPSPITLSWAAPPEPNRQWDGGGKVAVLRTHPGDLWRLVADRAPLPPAPEPGVSLAEWVAHWLGEDDPDARALVKLGTYAAPSETELRFLEEIVARELIRRAASADAAGLRAVHAMASLVGHAVRRIPDCTGVGGGCWILVENPPTGSPRRLGWGVLAVREGVGAAPIALEVPRPLREAGTWRLGAELWRTLGASVYLLGGIEPGAGGERGDPDPAALWNLRTPFEAYHQAIHGALGWEIAPLVLQIRGYGFDQPVTSDVVIALARAGAGLPTRLAEAQARGPLAFTAGKSRVADGSLALLELAGAGSPQLHYSSQVGGVPFAMLWFSEEIRARFRGRDAERELRRFALLGLDATPRPAAAALAGDPRRPLGPPPAAASPQLARRFDRLVALAERYALRENPHVLRQLRAEAGPGLRAGFCPELRVGWLLLEERDGAEVRRALILADAGNPGRVDLPGGTPSLEGAIRTLLVGRPAAITLHGSQP